MEKDLKTAHDERRRHRRRLTYGKATVEGHGLAYLRDISEAGARMSLLSAAPPKRGQIFTLRILEPKMNLILRARVVWAGRAGIFHELGIAFCDMSEPQRTQLIKIIHASQEAGLSEGVKIELLD